MTSSNDCQQQSSNEQKEVEPKLIQTCLASDRLKELVSCKQDENNCNSNSCPYLRVSRADLL